jgi:hypothetical protein
MSNILSQALSEVRCWKGEKTEKHLRRTMKALFVTKNAMRIAFASMTGTPRTSRSFVSVRQSENTSRSIFEVRGASLGKSRLGPVCFFPKTSPKKPTPVWVARNFFFGRRLGQCAEVGIFQLHFKSWIIIGIFPVGIVTYRGWFVSPLPQIFSSFAIP